MDAIEPVQYLGVGHYPFILHLSSPVSVAPMSSINPNAPVQAPESPYLDSGMDYILDRARRFFVQSNYSAAEKEYRTFFSFYHRYGPRVRIPQPTYFPALFELNWLLDLQRRKKAATEFYNQLLLQYLKPLEQKKTLHAKVIQNHIQHLQIEKRFPTEQAPEIPVEPKELVKLAKQMVAHDEKELAVEMLQFAQVQYQLEQARLEQLASTLQQGKKPAFDAHKINPMLATYGLPYAPIPLAGLHAYPAFPERQEPDLEKVTPVQRIQKEPDPGHHQHQRQH